MLAKSLLQIRKFCIDASKSASPLFLVDLKVVLKNDYSPPDGAVTEVIGKSNDINSGFGGSFVFLVPVWGSELKDAIYNIVPYTQCERSVDPSLVDLAAGAGGDYRYLFLDRSPKKFGLIRNIALVRRDSIPGNSVFEDSPPGWDPQVIASLFGYSVGSDDLNRNRKGKYLYLVWNKVV